MRLLGAPPPRFISSGTPRRSISHADVTSRDADHPHVHVRQRWLRSLSNASFVRHAGQSRDVPAAGTVTSAIPVFRRAQARASREIPQTGVVDAARQVAADVAFQNARQNSDDANARIEHERVLRGIVIKMVKDDADLFKHFMDDEGFQTRDDGCRVRTRV